ncbi:hypothetical protein [Niveispirillum irakense]|uniref:hypothetical protein n=1 Tax=Niveispirillum irakense TaxID=34011 RepID=UPI0003F92E48|nr:hypothetical protein [Niveispirillum irakense]
MNDITKPVGPETSESGAASGPKVEIIKLPNRLRAKVGGSEDGRPGLIDPAAIMRATTHVARLSDAHVTQTRIDLQELQESYRLALADQQNRAVHLRRVIKISDDILTLGKTFGYDLLSDFANALNHFLVPLTAPSPAQLQVVGLHIDAMHAIVRDEIKGDGGDLGKALSTSLSLARAKLGGKRMA